MAIASVLTPPPLTMSPPAPALYSLFSSELEALVSQLILLTITLGVILDQCGLWLCLSRTKGWSRYPQRRGDISLSRDSAFRKELLYGKLPASSTDLTILPPPPHTHTPHSTIYQRLSALCSVFEMIKWNSEESGSHTDKEWLKEPMELRWKHYKCWRRQCVKEAAGRFLSNRCKIQARRMICLLTKKSPPPRRPGPACWSRSSRSWQALKPKLGDYCTRHVSY